MLNSSDLFSFFAGWQYTDINCIYNIDTDDFYLHEHDILAGKCGMQYSYGQLLFSLKCRLKDIWHF